MKAGDRVLLVNTKPEFPEGHRIGMAGVVVGAGSLRNGWFVKWDGDPFGDGGKQRFYSPELLELEGFNPHEGADQYYMAVTGEDCG